MSCTESAGLEAPRPIRDEEAPTSAVVLLERYRNPNGILSQSPGLRGTRYPGKSSREYPQPQRGCVLPTNVKLIDMSQSLSTVYLHLVFSTKDRRPFLSNPTLRSEMHSFLAGASKQLDCPPILVGGIEDHVHLLARHGRNITQSDWVKEIKRVSSRWIKTRDPTLHDFAWQSGYGVFSVSASNLEVVRQYVAEQEAHHRKSTFQEELRALLQKHGAEWDERYVWD